MNEILKKAQQDLERSASHFGVLAAKSENPQKTKARYRDMIHIIEKNYLERLMVECDGNQSLAAKQSGLNRATIRSKLDQYNLL